MLGTNTQRFKLTNDDHYIPVHHDMMCQTNDRLPVRVMQHKVSEVFPINPLEKKILVKINLPGQKSHPLEQ